MRRPSGVAMRVHASPNVWGAINRTRFELGLGAHRDKELQAEWARNPACLTFDVLELVKERADARFDYKEELRLLEQLYRSELCVGVSA